MTPEELRETIKRLGLQQQQLADRFGVTVRTIGLGLTGSPVPKWLIFWLDMYERLHPKSGKAKGE